MDLNKRIYVAGHQGLVGAALLRHLQRRGCRNLILRSREELDLTRQSATRRFFLEQRPDYVFLAAAKVGGILANDRFPVEFIRDNLQIQTNVIDASHRSGVEKLLFLGSSCIYPRLAPQPIAEHTLLSGPLEQTNEWYAIAKISGIKLCQAYRRQYGFNAILLMPTNLYGPGDNFDLRSSHVLPALIRKCHEARVEKRGFVEVWGTGAPRREFLHVDDLADAAMFLMEHYQEPELINVGVGTDISIGDLAALVAEVVGFEGALRFDTSKPDGTPRKLLDVTRLHALGWQAKIPLRQGIQDTYEWYRSTITPQAP